MTNMTLRTPATIMGKSGALTVDTDFANPSIVTFAPDPVPVQNTTGGYGGPTLVVKTLEQTGPDSLPYLLKTINGKRIVTFDPNLHGVIELPAVLKLDGGDSDVTLEWSPRVALKGSQLWLTSLRNFIIRGLISLPGDGAIGQGKDNRDCLGVLNACQNGVIEGCLLLWGIDENFSIYPIEGNAPRGIEVRYNVIAEPLVNAGHSKGTHGYGTLIGTGVRDVAIHHNLLMTAVRRNPAIQDCDNVQVYNNIIAGWRDVATRMFGPEDFPIDRHMMIASNVYNRLGITTGEQPAIGMEHVPKRPFIRVEIEGNMWSDGRSADKLSYGDGIASMVQLSGLVSPLATARQTGLNEIIEDVLTKAGPVGDYHRERIVAQYRSGVAKLINSPSELPQTYEPYLT